MELLAEDGVEVEPDCALLAGVWALLSLLGGESEGKKSQKKAEKGEKIRKKSVVIFAREVQRCIWSCVFPQVEQSQIELSLQNSPSQCSL